MTFRTDRLGLLLEQLESSREISRARLEGVSDAEYLWEPAPGAWSLRRRGAATTAHAFGAGDWVLDHLRPAPHPAPVTTIAWRLGHLTASFAQRWDWTFGGHTLREDAVEFTPSAAEALDRFWALIERWQARVATLTDAQMDMVGFGQFPGGLDPQVPFIAIVWWTNREFIHHMAEIALLRDLWAAQGSALGQLPAR